VLPVFAGFRGGRGVATAFGGVLGLTPLVALAFPVIAACILIPTRLVSLMSILGTALAGGIVIAVVLFGWEPAAYAVYAIIAVIIIEYMHIPNLRRLLDGTEPRMGQDGDTAATG
jgi:glycerol-3-phosphate acyltransferase PlsY